MGAASDVPAGGPTNVLPASRSSRVMLAVVRVTVALLWIENTSWKRPPTFAHLSDPPSGLYLWTLNGVRHEVFAPWAWFVENVVLPNFVLFGWLVLIVEASLGAFLLVGLATRFFALVGMVQTVAIMFSVLNAPHEWFWAYFLMFVAHLALLATAAGRAYGVDAVLRPRWTQRSTAPSRLLLTVS
ncbi:MAG: DoxX family membrane protein [Pseudonocardiaceae bacterium]|nr:DoxX family membrane protein [Pseudonocardiaceae bacterium]